MSQKADLDARPKTESLYGSTDHKFVIGMNWIHVPGIGDMSVWVDKNGNTSNVTLYNSIVTSKKTHTPRKNCHWVGLEIKTDKRGVN